eukprot:scaffold240_cov243-Pinguiococcus_pyrenoidosus.AAC.6
MSCQSHRNLVRANARRGAPCKSRAKHSRPSSGRSAGFGGRYLLERTASDHAAVAVVEHWKLSSLPSLETLTQVARVRRRATNLSSCASDFARETACESWQRRDCAQLHTNLPLPGSNSASIWPH